MEHALRSIIAEHQESWIDFTNSGGNNRVRDSVLK